MTWVRCGLLVFLIAAALSAEATAAAQFAPSGGALLHSEEATKPPPPVVTEPPADAEKEEIKYDIAGYDCTSAKYFGQEGMFIKRRFMVLA